MSRRGSLPHEAFDETPRVALVLTDETMYLTRFDPRGVPIASYPVRSSDVAGAINQFKVDSGILPEQCLFWQMSRNVERVAVWLPPSVRTLTFQIGAREQTLRIPLPGFVFFGQGVHYFILAAKERPTRKTDQLYVAPLSNVGEDGLICAGNVKFPRCSPSMIYAAVELFFDSMFNADLSEDKVMSQKINPDLFKFLKSIQGKKCFPMEELIPSISMRELFSGEN